MSKKQDAINTIDETNINDEIAKVNDNETSIKLSIVKRNGAIVPFHGERIYKAIESAFCDTKQLDKNDMPRGMAQTIERLTQIVVNQATTLGKKGVSLTVEGIQDLVEVTMMKNGNHDVARDYIIYRDEHKAKRENSADNIRVVRKDGSSRARFKPMKLSSSIERAYRETHQVDSETLDAEVVEAINAITQSITEQVVEKATADGAVSVDTIQELTEQELMRGSLFTVAKFYILKHANALQTQPQKAAAETSDAEKSVTVVTAEGFTHTYTETDIKQRLLFAAKDHMEIINFDELLNMTWLNFYEEMPESEVHTALIMSARALVEKDPCYSFITARLLLDAVYQETIEASAMDENLEQVHKEYFATYIKNGISYERLNPELLDFDLERLGSAMKLERDHLFQYLGLQTLYDRYFIHQNKRRLETPQYFWMRVSMGLALKEDDKNARAIEFYNLLSQFYYMSATPTLFNSGTTHSQLSSCYLSTIQDDLSSIFKVISDDAQLSKWAGGIGNDWTNVRATGSLIHGTNGESQGIIPFLKVANDTAVAVNQGGKRKGAMCAYLETWHLDIEDFLELRKNTGDERRRTHDMNTANWIPDLFMQRVVEGGKWTLFSPKDTPDLHDLYGKAFKSRYEEYEQMAKDGKIENYKELNALDLWRKMLSMLFETGHPWITFKDPSNIRSAQDHKGVVHSSNLCTEILLNTSESETAVCNLGSVNLTKHLKDGKIDEEQLKKTISTAVRMLDNVIDINFYPTKEAGHANSQHRPIGLGMMGFQDILYMLNTSFASHEAVALSDEIMEKISYYAILASTQLAKERGTYGTYKGSKWERGLLPIDTIGLVEEERGGFCDMDRSATMDWDVVRKAVKKHGMRNSQVMAIAPTATIANIVGVVQSIEPSYKNLFVKSNLSGEFTVPNSYLIEKLKERNLWNDEMLDDLKYYDGSINEIEAIPDDIQALFATAFEIDPEWILQCGSRRQKWIDMGQSVNLYLGKPDGKKLSEMYILSWLLGMKTNYYMRTLGATQIEKSSTDVNKRGLQPRWMKNKSASSGVQVERKPTVCSMDEGCESCQ
ncbi:MAG: hypothetical protein S4CHLAM102_03020 [Chlamydiia bacterium]|nr:hypothetical protein [Chlamydiia bacterium]